MGRRPSTMRRSAAESVIGVNILSAMPRTAGPRDPGVELLELRVLDGPNRFFRRPAIKLEFTAETPGAAAEVAASAALAVKRLKSALDLPDPRIATRQSVDRRRTAIAFVWRRRAISQAVAAAAAKHRPRALDRSTRARQPPGGGARSAGPSAAPALSRSWPSPARTERARRRGSSPTSARRRGSAWE